MKSRGKRKPGKLEEHFGSDEHRAALKAYLDFTDSSRHVDNMIDVTRRNLAIQEAGDTLENFHVVKILFDICRTLARQDMYGLPWGWSS